MKRRHLGGVVDPLAFPPISASRRNRTSLLLFYLQHTNADDGG
jgi:hypothetical protein